MRDPPEQRAANRGGTIPWLRADSYDQGARVRPGREGTTRARGYDQGVGLRSERGDLKAVDAGNPDGGSPKSHHVPLQDLPWTKGIGGFVVMRWMRRVVVAGFEVSRDVDVIVRK